MLVNETQCRKYILEVATTRRPANKFRRVSNKTLLMLHELVRQKIFSYVTTHPSKGKTL